MTEGKRGPYQTVGGDTIWLPVTEYTFNEARRAAAQFAAEMGDDWSRTRYTGKHSVELCDHEGWDGSCPGKNLHGGELAWQFDVYEGTWRR